MNKIICSSQYLRNTINRFIIDNPTFFKDDLLPISTVGKVLMINDISMQVESSGDWHVELSFGKLKKVNKFLKRVPEQPLVISFEYDYMKFDNIII